MRRTIIISLILAVLTLYIYNSVSIFYVGEYNSKYFITHNDEPLRGVSVPGNLVIFRTAEPGLLTIKLLKTDGRCLIGGDYATPDLRVNYALDLNENGTLKLLHIPKFTPWKKIELKLSFSDCKELIMPGKFNSGTS